MGFNSAFKGLKLKISAFFLHLCALCGSHNHQRFYPVQHCLPFITEM